MRNVINAAFFIALAIATSACQQGGSVVLENPRALVPVSATDSGAEFVSSAAILTSTGGYKAYHSTGSAFPEMKQTSTGGYKLYSTVQGVLSSMQ